MASLTLQSTIKLSSGHLMPLLGFGVYQNVNNCKESCLSALEAGYRHIDSAQVYRNEAEVGKAIKQSGLKREDIFYTTKITSRYHQDASGAHLIEKSIDESIAKLGYDYIDLFLIHDPLSGKEKRVATYKVLSESKKIRSVGVSNYNIKHFEEIKAAGLPTPTVNQIELHPFCQQKPIVEYCKKNNIVVQAYCPLVKTRNWDNPVLIELSKKYNKEIAQILIRWSLQRGFVPLPKSEKRERIISNADVYDFEISAEDMAKLDGLDRGKAGAISWNPVDAS